MISKMATSFHFTKDPPPDSMFAEIQTLNKFNDEQFTQLVQIVFQFLLEPNKSSRLIEQLEEFSSQHGVSAAALKNVIKSLLTIPNSALRKNLGPTQLKEDFLTLGLAEEKSTYFAEQWQQNLLALSRTALGQTLMVNQLLDMEWKFGVTAASSELNQVGNTFIQLKLVVNKGNKTENVYMELTLPQFYSFLHEMEKAKASLEYFS
ncbi:COMM domain-containing protein 7-like [Lingula anatina]|uniref:COMM domain-containing protein 7-like n=1 Tax=Lingula anatina TaxID=7574 RepID=A0A1S3JFR7_LINAN|nr:COMM domain-containing protein 7-like [Lingula anatina]|eukprot:XP_013409245.1 COMM domain-containing protein 7-like [Lingula anatina]